MLLIFGWWFFILVAGLAAFPIAFVGLKYFPDRGYFFSKILALLGMGYLYWILGYVSAGTGTAVLALLLVAGVSTVLVWRWLRTAFFEFFKKNIGFFMVMELLFLMAFLVAGAYKMRTPDIAGTEKPMDFAMINGILTSPTMPPHDPWFSGGGISYYYFGYLIVAMIAKITQTSSGDAYNLAVALIWALAFVGAFSIAFALTRRYRYSFFSAACLAIFGNMDYWLRAVQSFRLGDLRIPYYNAAPSPGTPTGFSAMFGFMLSPLQHNWDYFQASRIIPSPPSDKYINEFPSFSFFLSDLHPHVMAIPFVLLALALAFNLLKSPLAGMGALGGRPVFQYLQWTILMLSFGALSFLNSWDFPTLLLLLGICLAFQQGWALKSDFKKWLKSMVLVGIPIVVGAFLLYEPFYYRFQSQAKGLGLVGERTNLIYIPVLFGLFLVVVVPALVGKARRISLDREPKPKSKKIEEMECAVCGKKETGKKFCGYCGGELVSLAGEELPPLTYGGVGVSLRKTAASIFAEDQPARSWLLLGGLALILLALNLGQIRMATVLAALVMMFLALMALAAKSETKEMTFTILVVFVAFLLVLFCELFYIRDLFDGGNLYRMNTVFKFHYQVWIFLSIAAGPLLKWLLEVQWPQWSAWKKVIWASLAGFAFLGAFLYPVLAFTARVGGTSADTATLDGTVFYQRVFQTDYQAAQWIQASVKPVAGKVPVILEAWGGSYHQEFARLATLTGYPTVLGWDFHESQWRGSWDQPAIRGGDPQDTVLRRRGDVDSIYTSADINQTRDLLKRYGVDYVYVGDVEREKYKDHAENLGKFSQLGVPVWSVGNSVLYKLNP